MTRPGSGALVIIQVHGPLWFHGSRVGTHGWEMSEWTTERMVMTSSSAECGWE